MKNVKITGMSFSLAALLVFICPICIASESPCLRFYDELSKQPYSNLELDSDGFVSIWDGKSMNGCEITFETNESLVSGSIVRQKFDSFINRQGWSINPKLMADGPGSSTVGIEDDQNRCIISWSQHAWIDENSDHQQTNEIMLIVQCSER